MVVPLLLFSFFLFAYEFIHINHDNSFIFDTAFKSLNLSFNILAFLVITLRANKKTDISICSKSLLFGVLCSCLCYAIIEQESFKSILYSWSRFSAYGNDPNYLCVYILLGVSTLMASKNSKKSVFDILLIGTSILFGFLTLSKMFILSLVLLFIL